MKKLFLIIIFITFIFFPKIKASDSYLDLIIMAELVAIIINEAIVLDQINEELVTQNTNLIAHTTAYYIPIKDNNATIRDLIQEIVDNWQTYLDYFGNPAAQNILRTSTLISTLTGTQSTLVNIETNSTNITGEELLNSSGNDFYNAIGTEFDIGNYTFTRKIDPYKANDSIQKAVDNFEDTYTANIDKINQVEEELLNIAIDVDASNNHSQIKKLSASVQAMEAEIYSNHFEIIKATQNVEIQKEEKQNYDESQDKAKIEEESYLGTFSILNIF